jgi:hypothetical protein
MFSDLCPIPPPIMQSRKKPVLLKPYFPFKFKKILLDLLCGSKQNHYNKNPLQQWLRGAMKGDKTLLMDTHTKFPLDREDRGWGENRYDRNLP